MVNKNFILVLIVSSTVLASAQQLADKKEIKHPFEGIPLEQSSVLTDEGHKLFRLKKVPSQRMLRNVKIPEEEQGIHWFERNYFQEFKETIFGKSQETKEIEEVYEILKNKSPATRKAILGDVGDEYLIENTLGLNFEYLLQLYCGENGDELSVTFDTGSDWTIVQSTGCSTCEGDMWDEQASSTYLQDYPFFNLLYGSAEVYGWYAHDQFYLDAEKEFGVENFDFMLIFYQTGISPSGGIMGFSRNIPFYGYLPAGPLFYYYLWYFYETDHLIFASYLADHPTESFFQVGAYDTEGLYYDGELVWLELVDDFFWMSTSNSYIVKGETYTYDTVYVELDTGTSLAYLDKKNGKKLMNKAASGNRGFKWFGTWYLKCDLEMFESVFIEIGGYYFEIPPSSYVRDFTEFDYKWCDYGFRWEDTDEPIWLVGDTLFRSYYNVWDEANSLVGFAIRSGSDATVQPYLA